MEQPEFKIDPNQVNRIESVLRSALSRRRNLANPPIQKRRIGLLPALIITAICSIAMGAGGTLMMTSQSRGEYELALLRAENELLVAEMFDEQERASLAQMEKLVATGAMSVMDTLDQKMKCIVADEKVQINRADLVEIKHRRAVPVDEITANIPASRDFVAERLNIRLNSLNYQIKVQNRRLANVKQVVDAGALSSRHLQQFQSDIQILMVRKSLVEKQLKLRAQFLETKKNARATELEASLFEYECEQRISEIKKDKLTSQVKRLESHEASRSTTELANAKAELEHVESKISGLKRIKAKLKELMQEK